MDYWQTRTLVQDLSERKGRQVSIVEKDGQKLVLHQHENEFTASEEVLVLLELSKRDLGIAKLVWYSDTFAYELEYVEGEDLFHYCSKHHVDLELWKAILKQIIIAVKRFHNVGLVHADLKLENIVWNPKLQQATLIDCCTAFSVGDEFPTLPRTRQPLTKVYTPKIAWLDKPRRDIYAIGIIALELAQHSAIQNDFTFSLLDDLADTYIEFIVAALVLEDVTLNQLEAIIK